MAIRNHHLIVLYDLLFYKRGFSFNNNDAFVRSSETARKIVRNSRKTSLIHEDLKMNDCASQQSGLGYCRIQLTNKQVSSHREYREGVCFHTEMSTTHFVLLNGPRVLERVQRCSSTMRSGHCALAFHWS